MIKSLNITSDIRPAGGGCLPCRISLHRSEGYLPIATHLEALQPGGSWARIHGHYFSEADFAEAVADYFERCGALGVRSYEEDPHA